MRVLHVGDDFAALRPCGLTLYTDALMRAQIARGHDVAYVFSGRHYPGLARPRLKRWSSHRVRMYELIGSPIRSHWEAGTRDPERDLAEPVGEAAFAAAVRESRPDVIHIQELARLPSSVIRRAKVLGIPVVMNLHDYKPVCAAVRLLDADGHRCLKQEIGRDCARNCGDAPEGPEHLIDWTMRYHRRRVKQAVPFLNRLHLSRLASALEIAISALRTRQTGPAGADPHASHRAPPTPGDYQRRRDVNIERLSACDRLIAPSARVAEVYATLGVDDSRLCVQRLTLPHLERLAPRRGPEVADPLRFVTLGGCASPAKGSRAVVEAVRRLERDGRGGEYRLLVLGHVEPFAARELVTVGSVSLPGSYAIEELDHLLDEPDVGILPSVWEESHGFVGIEMLAKGIPVIGSALGGIPEYVQPGVTGWLNRSASGAELAELMVRAIESPVEVQRLRSSVRARRRELVRPMDAHVDEVQALYAQLIEGDGARPGGSDRLR